MTIGLIASPLVIPGKIAQLALMDNGGGQLSYWAAHALINGNWKLIGSDPRVYIHSSRAHTPEFLVPLGALDVVIEGGIFEEHMPDKYGAWGAYTTRSAQFVYGAFTGEMPLSSALWEEGPPSTAPGYADPNPTPIPPPNVTPPQPELWQIYIDTAGINPALPGWAIERIRDIGFSGGWGIANIYPYNDGYQIDAEKNGSIVLALVVAAIIAIIAIVIWNSVRGWTAVRLSDNTLKQGNNLASMTSDIRALCEQGLLSQEECDNAIRTLTDAAAGLDPGNPQVPGLGLGGFGIGAAVVAIVVVLALSRK